MKIWVVLIPLGVLQLASGLFLLWDILGSMFGIASSPIAWVYYELAQIGAVIGLILGMVVSVTLMVRSIRRQRAAKKACGWRRGRSWMCCTRGLRTGG